MSTPLLKAFEPDPDLAEPADPFRCDHATIAQVLNWYEGDISRPIGSEAAEATRRRRWAICREALGSQLVVDAKGFQLKALINGQAGVRSNHTRRGWNTTIQRAFNEAEKIGLIVKNPFRGLSFPEGDEGRDWTDDELNAILHGASFAFRELLLGLRLSGMRPHEGCELQWPQLRIDRGDIKIDHHKTRYHTGAPRYVPLNEPLIELFASIRARQASASKWVFLTPKKHSWTRTHADSTFRRLRTKLKLPDDLKLHGCRHTFGTGAILNGVDVAIVMQILGHSDIRTTQRYLHLAGKTDHLAAPMNQAVAPREPVQAKKRAKTPHPTPLFDLLED